MPEPMTILVYQMPGESHDDYAKRCHTIATLIRPHLGPMTDTTALTIAGETNETGWAEIETPGYHTARLLSDDSSVLAQVAEDARAFYEE